MYDRAQEGQRLNLSFNSKGKREYVIIKGIMKPKVVSTSKAPKALGPYSQAVKVGGFVFCAGQIGIDPKTGELKEGVEEQTRQVLQNLKAVLEASGSSLERVVKTTIYLKNVKDFEKVNKIYAEYFGKIKPARATVEVSNLPKGALVEIEAVAVEND